MIQAAPVQLSLLTPAAPQPAIAAPIVTFEAVPPDVRLGDERYYIAVRHGGHDWRYPLQFRADELPSLTRHIAKWDWRLNSAGIPCELASIHECIEFWVTGGAA